MKKNLSLQTLMLMSFALGSASFMEANGACNKYTDKGEKKECAQDKNKIAEDKKLEDSIKKEYREIRRHFDKHHNVAEAQMKLKDADKRAKKFDVKIEKHEKSKTVAGIHKDSLKMISRHLHEHIDKYVHEHK
jgi:hypothetical protein